MTSNYSFHGNTLALHGSALRHLNICTHCCCPSQKIVLRPRRPFQGRFETSELFTKVILVRQNEIATLCLECQDVISDTVSARLVLM